jgi:hypothetical protein
MWLGSVRSGRVTVEHSAEQKSNRPNLSEVQFAAMSTPGTDWKETVPADEAQKFERYAEILRDLQRKNANGSAPNRALHAKGNLGLTAEFTVLPDLPEHARVALFGKAATYRAYVRYSNGSGKQQPDRTGDVRGIAIKLLGVEGKKLIPGMENALTQDFLLIHTSHTPVKNADEFVALVQGVSALPLGLFGFMGKVGVGRAFQILGQANKGIGVRMASVATTPYFSAVPIQFGNYAIHYALKPTASASADAKVGDGRDYLGDELITRVRQGPVSYDFQVQFYVDAQKTPIEDSSVEWKEQDSPFVTVGRLTIPQQDPTSEKGKKVSAFVEKLSFDPWHALTQFKPLGNMMRARNHAYRLSTQERKAGAEPDGTESFD